MHRMSSFPPIRGMMIMYRRMTSATPDTIAEKRKTIGIRTLLHHGFALMEPKMNPTYPCRRKADGMPMIGAAPSLEGLYVANGHAMLGLTLGPITGKLMADMIVGKKPSRDLAPLRPDRF